MDDWVFEQVKKVLPESDASGRYFWRGFVERIERRFDGLPAPDGKETFVRQCIAAGCRAVPVARRSSLWEQKAPPVSEKRLRGVYALRIRLALFFAGCLRYVVQGSGRLRVAAGESEWYPVMENGLPFSDFVAAQEGKVEVTWTNAAPDHGEAYFLAKYFFPLPDALMLTRPIAREVLNYLRPDDPAGLFGMMLYDDGQLEKMSVDVAGVFLEGLVEAVDQKVLRVNTRADGHVFVTPEFWLLTAPVGLGYVRDHLRTRRRGRRYNLPRHEIFGALAADGHLATAKDGHKGNAVWVCEVEVSGWNESLELRGLAILPESLPVQPNQVPLLEGTVTLKKENLGGRDKE
ncbi:MAG: hypothetical protein OXP66_02395 [Candidatus Tectomicrobia bacterium]|nr:hypothetical protein [Candidatus Tectomicrobia bacterium]